MNRETDISSAIEADRSVARSVLVVDDDQGLNNLAQKALRKAGFVTQGVFTGADAIALVRDDPNLMLLLDQKLPDMTGTELLSTLTDRGYDHPCIVMTGHGDEKTAVEMMKLGAMDYLVKELDLLDRLPGTFERAASAFETKWRLRRAEDKLRENEEKLGLLVENLSDRILILDKEGRTIWNSASVRQPDIKTEESGKVNIFDDTHTEDVPKLRAVFAAAIANPGQLFVSRHRSTSKPENARRWIHQEVTFKYLPDQPQINGVIAVCRDVTKTKEAEEEKEKLQIQLQRAQKMEAIGTLAGGISHDFNNLLQAINGYTQLLLMDKSHGDPEYRPLQAIQDAGFRASDLIHQLLLFSRKTDSTKKPVALQSEVEQARKMLERTIPKMVNIRVTIEDRLWPVMADPIQIEQMLLNLGTNAADAMPGGGELLIAIENKTLDEEYANRYLGAQPGRYIFLTVSDTGHGMDPETKEKIFEPFFTTKAFGKGTGLGLASVYGIVKSHGGYIDCHSEMGQGTTFRIFLPAMEQPEVDESVKVAARPRRGGTESILIVDDEEAIRDFAQQALVKFGYTVSTASSGEKALEIYAINPDKIDLVVMDLGMPGMGGHNCLQKLLQIDQAVKVVIASGYSIDSLVKKSMEAGASGYVSKPYQLNDLLNKVRDVLDH